MTDKKKICIVIMARLGSQRIKNKMLKKIGKKSLLENMLSKVNNHLISKRYNCYFACGEKEFFKIAHKYKNLKMITRNKQSVSSDKINEVFNFYTKIPEKYICWINACSPFLKISSIEDAISLFIKNKRIKSITTVVKKNTWIFNHYKKPLDNLKEINTKKLRDIFIATHNFHIYPKKRLLNKKFYFNSRKNDPFLYVLPDIESIDIDTYDHLDLAKKIKA